MGAEFGLTSEQRVPGAGGEISGIHARAIDRRTEHLAVARAQKAGAGRRDHQPGEVRREPLRGERVRRLVAKRGREAGVVGTQAQAAPVRRDRVVRPPERCERGALAVVRLGALGARRRSVLREQGERAPRGLERGIPAAEPKRRDAAVEVDVRAHHRGGRGSGRVTQNILDARVSLFVRNGFVVVSVW